MPSAKKRIDFEQTRKMRVFFLDDHSVVRAGVSGRIGMDPDVEVSGDAATAYETLSLLGYARAPIHRLS